MSLKCMQIPSKRTHASEAGFYSHLWHNMQNPLYVCLRWQKKNQTCIKYIQNYPGKRPQRNGGHIRPYPRVTFSPTPTRVTFALTSQSFPLNKSFNLLGFDLGTKDILGGLGDIGWGCTGSLSFLHLCITLHFSYHTGYQHTSRNGCFNIASRVSWKLLQVDVTLHHSMQSVWELLEMGVAM